MTFIITLVKGRAGKGGGGEKERFLNWLICSMISALLYIIAEMALKILYIPPVARGVRIMLNNALLIGIALAALTVSGCSWVMM